MQRIYLLSPKQVAAIIEVDERTVRNWCASGWCHAVKAGPRLWKIPTEELRKEYRHIPAEFWEELIEDLYKGLDGLASARMRLKRRAEGRHPSTGEKIDSSDK